MNEIKELRYIIIPTALYELNLNATELKMIGTIISYNFDEFYFSNEQLSQMLKISADSIVRAISNLKKLGLIETKYKIKANGGKIRIIRKTEKLLNIMKICNIEDKNQESTKEQAPTPQICKVENLDCKNITTPTMQICIENNNNKNNNNKNINPPLTPPFEKEGGWSIFSSLQNILNPKKLEIPLSNQTSSDQPTSKIDLCEGKWLAIEGFWAGGHDMPANPKNANIIENKPIWMDCKNDSQRLVAFWVMIEHPDLYLNAGEEQRHEFFRRLGRNASSILKMAGRLEIAMAAMMACRDWLRERGLSYNLSTIAKNIAIFVDEAIQIFKILPEANPLLVYRYSRAYLQAKGKNISIEKLAEAVRIKMRDEGKNANEVLENGISLLKQQMNANVEASLSR
jgi:biotin operon repressor